MYSKHFQKLHSTYGCGSKASCKQTGWSIGVQLDMVLFGPFLGHTQARHHQKQSLQQKDLPIKWSSSIASLFNLTSSGGPTFVLVLLGLHLEGPSPLNTRTLSPRMENSMYAFQFRGVSCKQVFLDIREACRRNTSPCLEKFCSTDVPRVLHDEMRDVPAFVVAYMKLTCNIKAR